MNRVYFAGRLTPEEFWQRITDSERQIRESAAILPLYGTADRLPQPAMLGNWEWQNGHLMKAGVSYGDPLGEGPLLHVQSTTRPTAEEVALARMASFGPSQDRENDVNRWRSAQDRTSETLDMSIDGSTVRFDLWRDGDQWWAAGEHAGHGVMIEARRLPPQPLALIRIDDLEPYLTGRRSYLRARRGERG